MEESEEREREREVARDREISGVWCAVGVRAHSVMFVDGRRSIEQTRPRPNPPGGAFAEVSARRCARASRRRGSKPLHHGICMIIITSVMPSWAELADTHHLLHLHPFQVCSTTCNPPREEQWSKKDISLLSVRCPVVRFVVAFIFI